MSLERIIRKYYTLVAYRQNKKKMHPHLKEEIKTKTSRQKLNLRFL